MVMLTDSPHLLAFSRHFCTDASDNCGNSEEIEFSDFCSTVLYECLADEKPELINTFIELYHSVRNLPRGENGPLLARNINILTTFYGRHNMQPHKELVPLPFLQSINDRVEAILDHQSKAALGQYLKDHVIPSASFACFLCYYEIPGLYVLDELFPKGNPSFPLPVLALRNKGKVSTKALLKLSSATTKA
eukprot:CAMPEP_0204833416 /NCGR_PEP_ID=MMETSP1346-20131115/16761_1 /ASSEMBLY_ACC=CAM_ASM_000771 /TAXON_ID=215587 /ORGANISM="Aplanochytrium stocchinoi, Strain GSBS06" /LENGTH=190 /DNA_ID=CAMNT_0051965937 /DNA_START=180 /DNA_END=752 /DNA_ORIENTATION=-